MAAVAQPDTGELRAGPPRTGSPRDAPASAPADRHLRSDVPARYAALSAQRQEREMTWKQIAEEVGGCAPGMLTGLAKAPHLGFPQAMRLVAWLGQPVAHFTVLRVLRSP